VNVDAIAAFGHATGIYAFMNTAYGWPAVEVVHFVALSVLLGSVGLFDLRALGVARAVRMPALHRLVPFGVGAFVVSALSGLVFFMSAPDQYMFYPAFRLKLACMAIAGVNVAVFYAAFAKRVGDGGADEEAPLPVKLVAGISLLAWVGVIAFGRLITMFRPPYHWCFACG
jgi:hypothetical protein